MCVSHIYTIYLEGYSNPRPKQEFNLFEERDSVVIWDRVFKELGYKGFHFKVSPKEIKNDSDLKKWIEIIKNNIWRKFGSIQPSKVKVIITGDHDEKNDLKKLQRTENIAKQISDNLFEYREFKVKIVLK